MFSVPDDDSELPSTPPRAERPFAPKSTTPGHDPPSYLTNVSTTPLGPPPRSIYGSSSFQPNTTYSRGKGTPLRGFSLPESSPPQQYDHGMSGAPANGDESFASRGMGGSRSAFVSSMRSSMRGSKRKRTQPRKESDMPAIARGLSKQRGMAQLQESDNVVLASEELVSSLDAKAQRQPLDQLDDTLATGSAQLARVWTQHAPPSTKEGAMGPAKNDITAKASYVGSLLLHMHHPHSGKPMQAAPTRSQRSSLAGQRAQSHAQPLPRALLDWINAHHNPYPDDYDNVFLHQPSPSASEFFWDSVYGSLLRGRFDRLIRLLTDAGWENANTALDDGSDEPGYHDSQLQNTEAAINRMIQVIQMCPAVKSGNWDVKGPEWSLFRQRVRQAITELEEFAEGDGNERERERGSGNVFAQTGRSDMQNSMGLSTMSRRAESKVPWTIYENMKSVYGQLVGSSDEIILVSQDWLEASIYLTVWWDGEDSADQSVSMTKSGFRRSMAGNQRTRESDVAPLAAYRNQLAGAFAMVTDEPEEPVFQPDTMDPVQVGIACVMEDNVEGAIAMLCSWSMSAASAIVEIAGLGGWLSQARPRSRGLAEQGFSSEDLMVLSHGPASKQPIGTYDRDEVLSHYADLLTHRDSFKSSASDVVKEGWELAVAVLGRLDNTKDAQAKIGNLLETLELKDDARVESVLGLCRELGLSEQARVIAEHHADNLATSSQAYGQALTFYARAHCAAKLKDTLSLLTSMSLIQSAATPATSQLDGPFAALLSKDRAGLLRLARSDPEAASILSSNLSGYATLRKFYDLRNQDVLTNPHTHLRPLERKREAAKALMAVIESASDCIRGGLFDPSIESAVPTDALLCLLGEVLPLLNSEKRIFSKAQVFALLRVVEDFATAPARVRERAGELFRASYNTHSGTAGSLNKTRSNMSSDSDLMGSYDMLAESVMGLAPQSGKDTGKDGKGIQRGWDWRKGLSGVGGASAGEKEVMGVLRLALAKEVGKGWGKGADW